MLFLRWDEHHIPRSHIADAILRFHSALPFHDEIEMLAVLVEVVRGRRALVVVHHTGQHVIDLRQLLVDEKSSLAPWYRRYQLWQIVLMEYIAHGFLLGRTRINAAGRPR